MAPTPYPDRNEVLETFVREVGEALADRLVAIYLQGSFAVGDFDVDWVAAVREPLRDREVAKLQETMRRAGA